MQVEMESKLLKLNMLERLNCIGKSRGKKRLLEDWEHSIPRRTYIGNS